MTITAREIYDAILSLSGRIDVMISQQADMQKDLTDVDTRVRQLEKARWPLPAVTVLISMAALVVAVFVN